MTPRLPPRRAMRRINIGTSGYVYKHWKGPFYPPELPARDYLPFFAGHFDTVELNTTFYRLPTRSAVEAWARLAPEGFVFAVKGSRYLTHIKRLKDTGEGVQRFFSAIEPLGEAVGPILWQLPPNMKRDVPRLAEFLEALPDGFHHVVEFRNPEWYTDEVYEALNDLSASLCVHDHPHGGNLGPFPPPGPIYYRRLHGATAKYGSRYGRARLRRPAAEIAALSRAGVPCFAYFNNDLNADAIHDAFLLKAIVTEAVREGLGAAELDR